MSVIRELIARFGIDSDDKGAKRAESLVEGLHKRVEAFGAAVVGAFAFREVGEFIKGQIEAGSAIHDTAVKLGVSNEELQKFQYLGKLAGVSAESMSGALGHMNRTMGEALSGNAEASKAFGSLGIKLKDATGEVRPASDVTLDFVDALDSMGSQAQRTAAITKVMGRAGADLLPAFEDGAEGVKKAFDEFEALGGGMSDKFVRQADEAGDQIDRLKFAFESLKARIVGAILPTLTKVTTWFTKATAIVGKFADHTNVISAALIALGAGGGLLAVTKLAKAFGIADTGALGFVKTLFKMGPIVLLAAALFLVFEDLYTLMTGGDSLIGRMLGGEESKKLVASLNAAFDGMGKALKDMLPVILDVGVSLLKGFVEALPAITKVLTVVLKGISAAIQLFSGGIQAADAALHGDWDKAGKAIDKAGDGVFGKGGVLEGLLDGFGGNTSSNLADTAAWQRPAAIPMTQIAAANAGLSLPSSIQQTNHVSVLVQGGQTNADTGRAVAGAITNAQKDKQATLAAVQTVAPPRADGLVLPAGIGGL